MPKISGKDAQFWFGGVEYPAESITFDADFDQQEVTDSSTPAPSTDFVTGRVGMSTKVDVLLNDADGVEVATGTLTANTKYRVTLGTIGGNLLGKIFTSNGSETASGTNKVKPLGAKLHGKNITLSVGGSTSYPVRALKYTDQYGSFESTDTSTAAGYKEKIAGRTKRTGTVEAYMQNTVADLLVSSPSVQALIFTFGPGQTLTGNGVFNKKGAAVQCKGDIVKVTYEITWYGPVVSTLSQLLTPAVSTAAIIIYKTGATTNKQVSGNAMVMSTSIDTDVDSPVKVSYTMDWIGAVTEAIAN
jgi:hypothetical protein